MKLSWLWLITNSHLWQHIISLYGCVFVFQIWKCEESLDRDLLVCGAAGREVYQVHAALVIQEFKCFLILSALMLNNCVFAAPCCECPSLSSPHEETSSWNWRRTGKRPAPELSVSSVWIFPFLKPLSISNVSFVNLSPSLFLKAAFLQCILSGSLSVYPSGRPSLEA